MRFHRTLGTVALILSVSGCITTEHGLCPPDGGETAVFDSGLIGEWAFVTENPDTPKNGLKVTGNEQPVRIARFKEGSRAYLISGPAEPGKVASDVPIIAYLVPIGGARYLDMQNSAPKTKNEKRHMLFKVNVTKDEMTWQAMDPMYFGNHPKALPITGPEVSGTIPMGKGLASKISFELPTLTAETAELRKFLEAHTNDAELWPSGMTMTCRRIGADLKAP